MMKKMSGKMNNMILWTDYYNAQMNLQKKICENIGYFDKKEKLELPTDDPQIMSYHVQQLISEIGEVLNADKRWKNFRNGKIDKENKLEEIADCFIVLTNIAIFSGISADEMLYAIYDKMRINRERIIGEA